jgi:hypothetical protein
MPAFRDLTGQRFGRLTVLERAENMGAETAWLCACDCGGRSVVRRNCLLPGLTKSCGCLQPEVAAAAKRTHGLHRSSTYKTWAAMKARCDKPRHPNYGAYGGRGITYDPRWAAFEAFLSDMGERPGPGLSLDRIDNDGAYSRDNCRWTTRTTQQRNRRATVSVAFRGEEYPSLTAMCEAYGIGPHRLARRRAAGMSPADAMEDVLATR